MSNENKLLKSLLAQHAQEEERRALLMQVLKEEKRREATLRHLMDRKKSRQAQNMSWVGRTSSVPIRSLIEPQRQQEQAALQAYIDSLIASTEPSYERDVSMLAPLLARLSQQNFTPHE